jgi:hypothetical protein
MPKVSVYLPEALYRAAQAENLPISALAQRAIEDELRVAATNRWIASTRTRPPREVGDFDMSKLMDEVRSELGA